MDLQPTGSSSELLFVEGNDFCFIIKGDASRIDFTKEDVLKIDSCGMDISVDYDSRMYFKEYSSYEVIIESKNGADIEFCHESSLIRKKLTPTRKGSKNLSGVINFGGDIGKSDLILKVNNRIVLVITIEVYPTKLDYKEDYEAILRDVNEEIYNLAFGFLSRTYLGAEINNRQNASNTEFYSILNYIFDKLIKAIDITIQNPHHQLIKESYVCKYQSLKNSSKDTIKWLEKRPHLMEERNGRHIPREALQTKKNVTVDTRENRFLKFILITINRKIDLFIRIYKKTSYDGKVDISIIDKLNEFKKKINIRLNNSYLKNINGEFKDASLSLVFTMASGYKEIYKYYLMLQRGLNINSNVFSLSIKELSLLYEYWCFIKINSLLRKKYKLISSDFIKIDKRGMNVTIKKGVSASLTYENTVTNERFTICYNGKKSSKTVGQKPDNILSMEKDGSQKHYEFIFDAKYKIDKTEKYREYYNGVGPTEEDINTMHRYRDAIVYGKGNETNKNSVFGAFVLFPYNDEENYRNHRFYKSIEEVNIGGIPFLPSSTKLMEEFLEEIIYESSYSTYERRIEKVGREEYINEDDFKHRNVLVGTLRDKKQLEINLNELFYHTAKKNTDLIKNKVEYIALYQSKNAFKEESGVLYYGKVKEILELERSKIIEIPKVSDEIYYKFVVEDWHTLNRKIEVKGQGVIRTAYTTEYLLNNADTIAELSIKDRDEFRLWRELKRIFKSIRIEEVQGDDSQHTLKFLQVGEKELILDKEKVKIIGKDRVEMVDRDVFEKNIRGFIKLLTI